MAEIVTDRQYQQILTASVAQRSSAVQDIVFKSTPLTRILLDSGRVRKYRAGGPELRVPVEYDKLDMQWFAGYDILNIQAKPILSSAVFDWSRAVGMFSLSGDELLFNRGREEVINLIEAYQSNAEKSVREGFEASLFGDGTGSGGRALVGLGAAIPTVPGSGIYGGINRATVSNWRTTYYDIPNGDLSGISTTWDATTAAQFISHITLARSRGGDYPDLWLFDANSWPAVETAFASRQRFVSDRRQRLNLPGYSMHTGAGVVDLIPVGGIGSVMNSNTAFGINTGSFGLWEFPGQSFVPFHSGGGMRPINQDAIAQGIVWSGQLAATNPLFNVRVKTAN